MQKLKKYSAELKLKAVKAYLGGEGSYRDISKKFGISHHDILRDWVLWYNGHREFKQRSSAKGEIYMTKGRKTTQEERAEIVTLLQFSLGNMAEKSTYFTYDVISRFFIY